MTPRQLYQLMVGEGGMSPTYFLNRLTYYEAQDFITGYNRRHRSTFEAARMIHGIIGGLFAQNYKLPEFPWDDENKPEAYEYTDEEMDRLRAEAEEWTEMLNNNLKNKER